MFILKTGRFNGYGYGYGGGYGDGYGNNNNGGPKPPKGPEPPVEDPNVTRKRKRNDDVWNRDSDNETTEEIRVRKQKEIINIRWKEKNDQRKLEKEREIEREIEKERERERNIEKARMEYPKNLPRHGDFANILNRE